MTTPVPDVECKKRKLQALLAVGKAQAAPERSRFARKGRPSPPPVEQPDVDAGGFFREVDALPQSPDDNRQISQVVQEGTNPTAQEELLDDSWILDDSDVQLAVKVCCSRFPSRKDCPPLALYTQLKGLLKGQSNLDLDRELKRLEENRQIVMFKFATAGHDMAVTTYPEFQKVLSRVAEAGDGTPSRTNASLLPEASHKPESGALQAESVRRLGRLLESGEFSVQMRTDELAQRLDAANKDAAQQQDGALGKPDDNSKGGSGAGTGNLMLEDLKMRMSRSPVGGTRAHRGPSRLSAGVTRGPQNQAVDKAASGRVMQHVDRLLQAGLLVRHKMGPVEVMRLTAPGAGSVMASVERARAEIRGVLKRKQRREAIEKSLLSTSLKSSTLGWQFHLNDMIGAGMLERVTHGNSSVLRLLTKS